MKNFFKTLHSCISFAKYQNESTTGIHVFHDDKVRKRNENVRGTVWGSIFWPL